jgi:hypothetical protein
MTTRRLHLRCLVCQHPQRPAIDLAIAMRCSKRQIGDRFKRSADAVWRHGKAHLTPEMRAALATLAPAGKLLISWTAVDRARPASAMAANSCAS